MNRQTAVDAVNVSGAIGQKGHLITYDKNGNRKSDTFVGVRGDLSNAAGNGKTTNTYTTTTETYSYDKLNRLTKVMRDATTLDQRYYDGAGRVF